MEHKNIAADDDTSLGTARRKVALEEYLFQGGFPELLEVKNKKGVCPKYLQLNSYEGYKMAFFDSLPGGVAKNGSDYLTGTPCSGISYRSLA